MSSSTTALEETIDNINKNLTLIVNYINQNKSQNTAPLQIDVKTLNEILDERRAAAKEVAAKEVEAKAAGSEAAAAKEVAAKEVEAKAAGSEAAAAKEVAGKEAAAKEVEMEVKMTGEEKKAWMAKLAARAGALAAEDKALGRKSWSPWGPRGGRGYKTQTTGTKRRNTKRKNIKRRSTKRRR